VKTLNYMTVTTRPDITFAVSLVSQFLSTLKTTHLEVVIRTLRYLKKAAGKRLLYSDQTHSSSRLLRCRLTGCSFDRRSTRGYCIFLEKILCHEKERSVVWSLSLLQSREYMAIENVTLELIRIRDLLIEVDFPQECPMRPYGDNKTAIHIIASVVFHERIKHIEINCHIVCKKLEANIIVVRHVLSGY